MVAPGVQEVLECLPQAVARVDRRLAVQWAEPSFEAKTRFVLRVGQSLLECLEPGAHRDCLEQAVRGGRGYSGHVITRGLHQFRVRAQPVAESDGTLCWVVFESCSAEEEMSFAQALQEIANTVGQTLDMEAVCAAAVVAMVRCARVCRAEAYLREGEQLRRVAVSDLGGSSAADHLELYSEGALKQALATCQPQLGVSQGTGDSSGSIFAVVPLIAQRQSAGALVLFKEKGASFSIRELDLWAAAAAQLTMAVENARLLGEAQAALRTRDEFMSLASHELKTPLTPLKLTLYTMERRLSQGLGVELSSIVKSKRQVDRLASLVNDLLDVSRLQLGKLAVHSAPLEFSHLVTEVVEEFRVAFDRNFEMVVPDEPVWVMGERDRLEQVLVNLLENAQKYSPQDEPISVELESDASELRLRVIDRGIGIPAAECAQVFERFYRAKAAANRNFGGLGLGLFISRSILQLHGGELHLDSEEGRRTTFTLELPLLEQRDARQVPRRILVLEQDPAQQAAAKLLLGQEGFEVVAAANCAQALHALSQVRVDLMLVSSDLACGSEAGFVHALHSSPTGRPLPLLFGGPRVPSWAGPTALRCERPYQSAQLGVAARRAMGVPSLVQQTQEDIFQRCT